MADSYGPRIYLVGRILSALLTKPWSDHDECVNEAIRLADLTLDKLTWPDGKPGETLFNPEDPKAAKSIP